MSYVVDLEKIPYENVPYSEDSLALLNRDDIQKTGGDYAGSVDLTKVVGTTHRSYGGRAWGVLKPTEDSDRCGLQRLERSMRDLKANPEYYLSRSKKVGWEFLKIGDEYYIDAGVHRTILARFFLGANQLPQVVHGVSITEAVWKEKTKGKSGSHENPCVNQDADNPARTGKPEMFAEGSKTYIGKAIAYVRNMLDLTASVDQSSCVKDGLYIGSIVHVAGGVVGQKINRNGDSVQHDAAKLSSSVKVGDVVEIAYRDGLGVVSSRGPSLGVGR